MPTEVVITNNLAAFEAFAGEQLTVGIAAVGPTAATRDPATGASGLAAGAENTLPNASGDPAKACTVSLEIGTGGATTNAIRVRYDGTDPTGAIGMRVPVSDGSFRIEGEANVRKLRMIRATDTTVSPIVFITYER